MAEIKRQHSAPSWVQPVTQHPRSPPRVPTHYDFDRCPGKQLLAVLLGFIYNYSRCAYQPAKSRVLPGRSLSISVGHATPRWCEVDGCAWKGNNTDSIWLIMSQISSLHGRRRAASQPASSPPNVQGGRHALAMDLGIYVYVVFIFADFSFSMQQQQVVFVIRGII